jgi:hypothetical protein
VPSFTASGSGASFVKPGDPIPVRSLDTNQSGVLTPKKLGVICSFTRELLEHSTPNAEVLVRQVVSANIASKIDSVLFGSAAATDSDPPGLLNGVTATPAQGGGGVSAMMIDLGKLAGAVAPVGGLDVVFVADPQSAVKIAIGAGPDFRFDVLASSALPSNTVVAVAPIALVAAVDPVVRFSSSKEATPQMDTSPVADPLTGSPVRSFWQTDSVGTRLILTASARSLGCRT